MTTTRGQLKIRQGKRLSEADQTVVVHMNPAEFLDYAIRTKLQHGLTIDQSVEWVDQALANAGVVSKTWLEYKEGLKGVLSYLPIGLDAAALGAIAAEMKRGGHVFSTYTINRINGIDYVIFNGYAGLRKNLKGTRYLANNPKVVSFAIGNRGISSVVKQGLLISIFISAGFHAVDQLLDDQRTWHDFVGGVAVDVAVAAVSSGIAWGAVATFVGGATAMVAVGPLIALVAVGTLVTFFISRTIDTKALADMMADWLETMENGINAELESVVSKVDRVEREYNSDPLAFLHRLFGVPRPGIRATHY